MFFTIQVAAILMQWSVKIALDIRR